MRVGAALWCNDLLVIHFFLGESPQRCLIWIANIANFALNLIFLRHQRFVSRHWPSMVLSHCLVIPVIGSLNPSALSKEMHGIFSAEAIEGTRFSLEKYCHDTRRGASRLQVLIFSTTQRPRYHRTLLPLHFLQKLANSGETPQVTSSHPRSSRLASWMASVFWHERNCREAPLSDLISRVMLPHFSVHGFQFNHVARDVATRRFCTFSCCWAFWS